MKQSLYEVQRSDELSKIQGAARALLEGKLDETLSFLRAHPDLIGEFCIQVKELYQEGDNSGMYDLAHLIKVLLDKETSTPEIANPSGGVEQVQKSSRQDITGTTEKPRSDRGNKRGYFH